MDGFSEYRDAARAGITAGGAVPVLVEDFPSLSTSPRNACLDGVQSCDALALIIGSRGGWTAPSGKLVVEEELEEAERSGLSVLVFIQDTSRDVEAKNLVSRISAYSGGYFRTTFDSPSSLSEKIQNAIATISSTRRNRMRSLKTYFTDDRRQVREQPDETILRYVVCSQREEEVLAPSRFGSQQFGNEILQIAHRPDVALMSFDFGKTRSVRQNSMTLTQGVDRRHRPVDYVRLELTPSGVILVDSNVTNLMPPAKETSMQGFHEIVSDDIRARLLASFAFVHVFWNHIDPYLRHQQFLWNAALVNVGHRKLVDDRNERNSFSIGFEERDLVKPFERDRTVHRASLASADEYCEDLVAVLRRVLTDDH